MVPLKKVKAKSTGMEVNLEDVLDEKLALVLEYDKFTDLGECWAPSKGLFWYQGIV